MMNISISDDGNMDDVGMENAGVPGVASSTFENDDSPELRQEILKNINRLQTGSMKVNNDRYGLDDGDEVKCDDPEYDSESPELGAKQTHLSQKPSESSYDPRLHQNMQMTPNIVFNNHNYVQNINMIQENTGKENPTFGKMGGFKDNISEKKQRRTKGMRMWYVNYK